MQLPSEIEALRSPLLRGLKTLGWTEKPGPAMASPAAGPAAGPITSAITSAIADPTSSANSSSPTNSSGGQPDTPGCNTALRLPAGAPDQLLSYLALLHKWNKAYNLTAVRDPKDMLSLHLLDCLATITPIEQHLGYSPRELIDVGSGGGLPGVVYAIAWPEGQQHLVDTVGKKAAFLQQCKLQLKLPHMHAHHQRIEQLKLPETGQSAGNGNAASRSNASPRIFTCRAFASLHDFVSQTWHLREPGSQWIALKGQWPEQEVAELHNKTARELHTQFKLHRIEVHPPGLEEAQRHLICLESLGTAA